MKKEQHFYGRLAPAHVKLAVKAKSILDKKQCAKDIYCLLTSNRCQTKEYHE
jgi:hypothetical protein